MPSTRSRCGLDVFLFPPCGEKQNACSAASCKLDTARPDVAPDAALLPIARDGEKMPKADEGRSCLSRFGAVRTNWLRSPLIRPVGHLLPARREKEDDYSAALCTPDTARPDGSAIFAKLASQAIAAGDEQAMDLPPGTVSAQACPG